ncbi:undecaprenyl diphosphate synthase family protein-like protein [Eremomyces bilateralis CBS 781.70]|uniref:Alkyl transferase n=1 Tax=Eremomyces bilateralis CBS 781.70 TaxID=1392243 RepID=A0A6G1G7M4_9PEZI|nr:undecaprenyl diphosphate synthase family protein-like protein [Eremomyces bilateralis CBS 781.70]KAF1813849.1 undecaprenyl diphosphate synthase family protein-like protein [Eremomyces bilateralis CBS 781.70]
MTSVKKWIAQSPPVEWVTQQARELLMGTLRQGPIPQHVAFVMDGNRRFARGNNMETIEGHNLGFEALVTTLEVCYKVGVRVVSVYAFSIENFKRSKYEVDALMDMAKVKIGQLAQYGELMQMYGVRFQFLGRREMLRPDVLEVIDRAIESTSKNGRAILNICAPYTSRDEITTAIRDTVIDYSKPVPPSFKRPFSENRIARNIRAQQLASGSDGPAENDSQFQPDGAPQTEAGASQAPDNTTNGRSDADSASVTSASHTSNTLRPSTTTSTTSPTTFPDPETITSATLTDYMFTAGMPPLDLFIRTSGVERLSDFMLWQCHENTEIVFVNSLWPEFGLARFLPVLLEWQWDQMTGNRGGKGRWNGRGLKVA